MNISKIEAIEGLHTVYDIEVDIDHSFIVEGCVLHNSRTCARLDQTTYLKGDSKLSSVTPPLHPNCRSALTFDVDDRFKLDAGDTKKASSFNVDGKRDPKPIDSDSIYYENLKKLSARDQDVAIGPTLGKALRKMDAKTFAKMTGDSMNNALTIKQMKEKNNELGRILRSQ
mgnify:CR=1 FL=1